jgi:hypothetical protein
VIFCLRATAETSETRRAIKMLSDSSTINGQNMARETFLVRMRQQHHGRGVARGYDGHFLQLNSLSPAPKCVRINWVFENFHKSIFFFFLV